MEMSLFWLDILLHTTTKGYAYIAQSLTEIGTGWTVNLQRDKHGVLSAGKSEGKYNRPRKNTTDSIEISCT